MAMTIDIHDAKLSVTQLGAGPPLLLVHGFPLDHTMWLPVAQRLANKFRVIVPDLRGFGSSNGAVGDALTMEQHADDLAGLLDALQIVEPVSLAGLSMGGYIALAFWRRHAARLGKLMLCDTRAAGDTPQVVEGRMATIERVRAEGASAAAEAMLPKLFAASTSSKQPKLVEQTRQVILNTSADTLAAALRGMAQRPDMRPELAKLSVPTLLLCGAEDAITPPAEMHSLTSALPHASYIEIAEAGHMSPLEQPDAVASAIETFLRTP